MNKILRVIAKIVLSLVWIVLLLAVLLCPNYIANPVVTSAMHLYYSGDSSAFAVSILKKFDIDADLYTWAYEKIILLNKVTLKVWFYAALLIIAGTCAFCLFRSLYRRAKKDDFAERLPAPNAHRRINRIFFCVLLLTILLVRPNPVVTTLLTPFLRIRMPWEAVQFLLGPNSVNIGSGADIYCYPTISGQYLIVSFYGSDYLGLVLGDYNYPYLIHMILIAVFVAVTRFGVTARDKWLRHAQPSQPGKTQMPE